MPHSSPRHAPRRQWPETAQDTRLEWSNFDPLAAPRGRSGNAECSTGSHHTDSVNDCLPVLSPVLLINYRPPTPIPLSHSSTGGPNSGQDVEAASQQRLGSLLAHTAQDPAPRPSTPIGGTRQLTQARRAKGHAVRSKDPTEGGLVVAVNPRQGQRDVGMPNAHITGREEGRETDPAVYGRETVEEQHLLSRRLAVAPRVDFSAEFSEKTSQAKRTEKLVDTAKQEKCSPHGLNSSRAAPEVDSIERVCERSRESWRRDTVIRMQRSSLPSTANSENQHNGRTRDARMPRPPALPTDSSRSLSQSQVLAHQVRPDVRSTPTLPLLALEPQYGDFPDPDSSSRLPPRLEDRSPDQQHFEHAPASSQLSLSSQRTPCDTPPSTSHSLAQTIGEGEIMLLPIGNGAVEEGDGNRRSDLLRRSSDALKSAWKVVLAALKRDGVSEETRERAQKALKRCREWGWADDTTTSSYRCADSCEIERGNVFEGTRRALEGEADAVWLDAGTDPPIEGGSGRAGFDVFTAPVDREGAKVHAVDVGAFITNGLKGKGKERADTAEEEFGKENQGRTLRDLQGFQITSDQNSHWIPHYPVDQPSLCSSSALKDYLNKHYTGGILDRDERATPFDTPPIPSESSQSETTPLLSTRALRSPFTASHSKEPLVFHSSIERSQASPDSGSANVLLTSPISRPTPIPPCPSRRPELSILSALTHAQSNQAAAASPTAALSAAGTARHARQKFAQRFLSLDNLRARMQSLGFNQAQAPYIPLSREEHEAALRDVNRRIEDWVDSVGCAGCVAADQTLKADGDGDDGNAAEQNGRKRRAGRSMRDGPGEGKPMERGHGSGNWKRRGGVLGGLRGLVKKVSFMKNERSDFGVAEGAVEKGRECTA